MVISPRFVHFTGFVWVCQFGFGLLDFGIKSKAWELRVDIFLKVNQRATFPPLTKARNGVACDTKESNIQTELSLLVRLATSKRLTYIKP